MNADESSMSVFVRARPRPVPPNLNTYNGPGQKVAAEMEECMAAHAPITPDMTVADVIARHPNAIELLAAQHAAFERLRNPLLRKAFSRLVTLRQAAAIAGVDLALLLDALNRGSELALPAAGALDTAAGEPGSPPPWFDATRVAARLDVRAAQRAGQEPLADIMRAVRGLPPGGILALRNTFEPLPLYTVLGRRGFQSWARCLADDDWEIFFVQAVPAPARANTEEPADTPARTITLDNRGMEPPQPMMRVLAALDASGSHDTIVALTDRVPLLLFDELNERGLSYTAEQQPDGAHRVTISRGAAQAPQEARSLE
jgi:hypothetical protein